MQIQSIKTRFEMHGIDGSYPCGGAITRLTPETQSRQTICTGAMTHRLNNLVQHFARGLRVLQQSPGQPATQSRIADLSEAAWR
jgi:hypothetical protein